MTGAGMQTAPTPTMADIQGGWNDLTLKLKELSEEERTRGALELENKSLRTLLETVIAHRQKSHNELVVLLTTLISKLPINDIGILVSRLVEHNNNVNHFLGAITKGGPDAPMEQPELIKTLEQAEADQTSAVKPLVEELCACKAPLENEMLQSLIDEPGLFYKPATQCGRASVM